MSPPTWYLPSEASINAISLALQDPLPSLFICNRSNLLIAALNKHAALDMLGLSELLIRHAHLSGISRMWHPLGTGSWCRLLQHAVDLLEGEALGLGDEDVGVDDAEEAEGAPEEEDLGAEVDTAAVGGGQVGGDDCDDLCRVLAYVPWETDDM